MLTHSLVIKTICLFTAYVLTNLLKGNYTENDIFALITDVSSVFICTVGKILIMH